VMFTKKGISETVILDPKGLDDLYNITPKQVIDLKALMGDTSDNIPGISGVGEKTALNLIHSYGSLDNVYNNIDKISGKLKEKLINEKDIAYLSKELATIKCDVDLTVNLQDLTYEFPFGKDVLELFKKYQFNSLLKRPDLFLSHTPDSELTTKMNAKIKKEEINTIDQVKAFISRAKLYNQMYLHLNDNLNICVNDCEYNFNFNQDLLSEGLDVKEVLNLLKPIFINEEIKKSVFDYKQILHILSKYGLTLKGVDFDILIARYLINNNAKTNAVLNDIITEQNLSLNYRSYNIKLITDIYRQKLNELNLEKLFYEIEMPLITILFNMETAGFKIDLNALDVLDSEYAQQINDLTNKIYELAGTQFNINSPKQLADILFNKLKITAYNNKKNSTGIDVLNDIYDKHKIVPKIIEYRSVSKLYTTYIKAFKELVDKNTHKIHTIFKQNITATGRLSSVEPNLQNIPIRTEDGRLFRRIFISSFKDGYILSADYSQIELRLMAYFSGDTDLIKAFNNGEDIHTKTAAEIFGVSLNEVTSSMRRDAKAINFGIIYGISDYGLSLNIHTSKADAAEYIRKYFEKYPMVKAFMDSSVKFCRENGFIRSLFGRIRYINDINNTKYVLRQFSERAAMNMPLQGTASDIIKLAMIKISNEMKEKNLKSKLILQIHDELVFDCDKSEIEIVKEIAERNMENVVKLPVDLKVSIAYGKNWYEA